ncbi:hypothetical protein PFISCL1PPCAC_7773 [Pristionchus fissidentatus]|uniref:Uncharacterized protein n=1 Tax=Pristionchus fissidentatus TaxID=1538716 RepID=A0AAV5VCL7_9BILA|nr:hypothetical protein PFISCL1PPCAC_7773 [Pristionchus fissidentatus]
MFLRCQPICRLPTYALRIGCSAAPSTSSAPLRLPLGAALVSCRCSHVIATSSAELARHLGASFVWIRGGGPKDYEEAEEVKGERTKHTNSSSSGGGNDGQEPLKPVGKAPPHKMKMFIVAALMSFAITSLLFSTIIAESTVSDSAIPADAPQVDFATFAKKYLRAGEIQKITFVVGKEKAVGTLHPGAVIDGKTAKSGHVVINYPQSPAQFWADVRKEEADMGIALSQGVDIQPLNPVSGWRMFEFFIGCFILGWLGTQYGRLLMKRMAEAKAKQAGK